MDENILQWWHTVAIKASEKMSLPASFSVHSHVSAQVSNISSTFYSPAGNTVQLMHWKKKKKSSLISPSFSFLSQSILLMAWSPLQSCSVSFGAHAAPHSPAPSSHPGLLSILPTSGTHLQPWHRAGREIPKKKHSEAWKEDDLVA